MLLAVQQAALQLERCSMDRFQKALLGTAALLMVLLILAQSLLLFDKPRRILSRTDRLEGRPWQEQLASPVVDVIN